MKNQGKIQRFALVLTLVFAVFSSGAVIVHQCHSAQSSVTQSQTHSEGHSVSIGSEMYIPNSAPMDLSKNMLEGGCAAILIVFLLLGRKFLLKTLQGSFRSGWIVLETTIRVAKLKQNLEITCTRSQLGVFRI